MHYLAPPSLREEELLSSRNIQSSLEREGICNPPREVAMRIDDVTNSAESQGQH